LAELKQNKEEYRRKKEIEKEKKDAVEEVPTTDKRKRSRSQSGSPKPPDF
jgi:hypothetical protein